MEMSEGTAWGARAAAAIEKLRFEIHRLDTIWWYRQYRWAAQCQRWMRRHLARRKRGQRREE